MEENKQAIYTVAGQRDLGEILKLVMDELGLNGIMIDVMFTKCHMDASGVNDKNQGLVVSKRGGAKRESPYCGRCA